MAISLNQALLTAKEAPCSCELTEILMNELQEGNAVMSFSKITSSPDETYYILLFKDMPKVNYPETKICRKKDGSEYIVISLIDKGCTEIRFNY